MYFSYFQKKRKKLKVVLSEEKKTTLSLHWSRWLGRTRSSVFWLHNGSLWFHTPRAGNPLLLSYPWSDAAVASKVILRMAALVFILLIHALFIVETSTIKQALTMELNYTLAEHGRPLGLATTVTLNFQSLRELPASPLLNQTKPKSLCPLPQEATWFPTERELSELSWLLEQWARKSTASLWHCFHSIPAPNASSLRWVQPKPLGNMWPSRTRNVTQHKTIKALWVMAAWSGYFSSGV